MYSPNCRAYLRHDRTASTKQIRLSAHLWSLIHSTQDELAAALGVPRVSRPVALRYILEEAQRHGICHYKPQTTQEK